jgi:hypothetical protein
LKNNGIIIGKQWDNNNGNNNNQNNNNNFIRDECGDAKKKHTTEFNDPQTY